MRLVIDVMGFENDIKEAINACCKFQKQHQDVEFILVGNKSLIEQRLKSSNRYEILDAEDVIMMNDNPMIAIRKTNSSMYKAIEYVASNKADGVLSAGSSACYVAMTFLLLKLIKDVHKLAFMPYVPTVNKCGFNMLDVGANKECSGEDLYQFAKMATIYCQQIRNIENPTIGIINIGTEVDKGFPYQKEAYSLMSNDKLINFKGYVEPRELLKGVIDVAISDGYTGNLTLKSLEGGLGALKAGLKHEYKKPYNWLGAFTSLLAIKGLSKTFDYKNNAGAFLIGLQKPAVKTHGSADKQQFFSAIRLLYDIVKKDVVGKITNALGSK